jgi:hypothetical protein
MSVPLTCFEQTIYVHCGLAFISFGIVVLIKDLYKLQHCIIRDFSVELSLLLGYVVESLGNQLLLF